MALLMHTSEIEKARPDNEEKASRPSESAETQWLCWLHEMLPNVARLMLFRVKPNQSTELCAFNPAGTVASEQINNAVLSCVHRQRAIYLNDIANNQQHLLTIPFRIEQSVHSYVLVMLTAGLEPVQQNTAVQLVQWAATQLREPSTNTASGASRHLSPDAQLSHALVGAQQRHGSYTSVAFALVNTLVNLCGCARVSLGCYDGHKLRLVAMSGQSKLDDRRTIARQLCALMLDTLDSRQAIYPDADNNLVPSMQAYHKSQGEHALFSFVIPGSRVDQFVLVLERDKSNPFLPAQVEAIKQSVQGSASFLELSRSEGIPLRKKIQSSVRSSITQWRWVKNWSKRRWVAAVLCTAFLLSLVVPVKHRVSADAFIEASDRQVLVAAQDGFILSAHARAGEEVAKGALLAKIDGKDLQLGLEKWHSEKSKNQQEYAQALAIHDRSELSRLRSDAKRIDAEIALYEQQLRRSEVRAPFDGVLLDGDWTQSLGAPVKAGDVLFEIASAEEYRLILKVDEHDIGYIKPEQMAELRMAALPTSVWQAELGDVMPVAISEKGSSAFRVPANIAGVADALRPGMEGVGKVNIGDRAMFWVFTHKLVDKLRYLAWKAGFL